MARNQLLCLSLAILVLFSFLSKAEPAGDNDAVTLSLYYETMCPYCANFIVNHLAKVFDSGLISILNLRLIPWGNAWTNPDGAVVCQHGTDECFLNAIEACTITIYPDVERHFRLIHCIERQILENNGSEWSSCFQLTQLGEVPIDCYKTGYGDVLEHKYGDETEKLNPPHRFVPWVVVDDRPLEEDFENFMSYVCKAYKGNRVPDACKTLTLDDEQYDVRANLADRVCYAALEKKDHASEQVLRSNMLP